jgi:hypothetical protein
MISSVEQQCNYFLDHFLLQNYAIEKEYKKSRLYYCKSFSQTNIKLNVRMI